MNTFFDNLKNIIYTKDKELINQELDYKNFSIFMMNKWLSFYSDDMCEYINKLSNTNSKVFDDQRDWYKFLFVTIPPLKFKKINYIKKISEKEEKLDGDVIEFLANKMEMSQKEVREYVINCNVDLNMIKKVIIYKENKT